MTMHTVSFTIHGTTYSIAHNPDWSGDAHVHVEGNDEPIATLPGLLLIACGREAALSEAAGAVEDVIDRIPRVPAGIEPAGASQQPKTAPAIMMRHVGLRVRVAWPDGSTSEGTVGLDRIVRWDDGSTTHTERLNESVRKLGAEVKLFKPGLKKAKKPTSMKGSQSRETAVPESFRVSVRRGIDDFITHESSFPSLQAARGYYETVCVPGSVKTLEHRAAGKSRFVILALESMKGGPS